MTACACCGADQWDFVRSGRDLYRPNSPFLTLGQCSSCGHIAQTPRPSEELLKEAYAVAYSPYRPAWKQPGWPIWKILRTITTWRRVSRLKRYGGGSYLLEVGAGAGDFLSGAIRAGWKVAAVEYNKEMVDAIRAELGCDVRVGELRPQLWDSENFDVILFWNVLEHVLDPVETLRTAAAYLRPGGPVLIQIPTVQSAQLGMKFGQYWALLDFPRHINFFSRNSLSRVCDQAGMDLVLFRTSFIDEAWCYLASCWNHASVKQNRVWRMMHFGLLAATMLFALPQMIIRNWQNRGTEAFAVARKRATVSQ